MKTKLLFLKGSLAFALSFFAVFPLWAQWSNVGGNVSFNPAYGSNYSFAKDKQDTLYTAFADMGNQYIVTVKKRSSGGTWQNVGTPGFITGSGSGGGLFNSPGIAIAINPVTNEPYVALSDGDNDNKVSVMRFNGLAWVYVGPAGFSSPDACGVKLAFTFTGILYVSFSSCHNGSGISVMQYNGQWIYAGQPDFATGNYAQLSITPNNTVYVAFQDQDQASKLSVKRFNAGTWSYVGTPGFSDGDASQISLTADTGNTLYISYSDYSHASKITVQKLMGNTWNVLGTPSFSQFTAQFTSISVNRFGIPFVSYVEGSFPVAQRFKNGAWTKLGSYIITTSCSYTSILNDTLGNPYVLMALQPSSFPLPYVYTYRSCNDTDYHFVASAVLDSVVSTTGDSATVIVTATGGQPPYRGTGIFKVAPGYYTHTITDGGGCTTTVSINVPAPCTQNNWTGNSSTDWEDAGNWSCGAVPGVNTVVNVPAGLTNYPVVHSMVTCKQLHVSPGVSVRVATGANLLIIGP